MSQRFAIAVHGGAGRVPDARARPPGRRGLDAAMLRALEAGEAVLGRGGSALRAAIAATVVLEDDPQFNAGRGAVLCRDGSVELSASVMDGKTQRVGAVVGVRRTRNPILAAEALLEHRHCLLFGAHADAFAAAHGLPGVEPDYFVTTARREQWERHSDRSQARLDHDGNILDDVRGTVGAVARDRAGRLAAATSTGGMLNQAPGRVGDSPVVGAGTFANAHCAVSATGTGEAFFRVAFARRVADLVELAGLSPSEAAVRGLDEVRAVGGEGGCIAIDAGGRVAATMNSSHMVRGVLVEGEDARTGIAADDDA